MTAKPLKIGETVERIKAQCKNPTQPYQRKGYKFIIREMRGDILYDADGNSHITRNVKRVS